MTMDEIVRRLEKAEKKIAALEETLETIKQMNISEQMQEYIESRQRTVQLTGLLNSLSGQGLVDTSEAERQIAVAQAKKKTADKQIREAIASASIIETENASPAELFTYVGCTCESKSGLRITGYNGFDERVIAIPASISGRTVISIGEKAFYNGTMEEIVLPASLISISASAFENCSKLKKINIPNMLVSIGEKAFSRCISLEEIILPDGINKLGEWCFYNSGIKKINFPAKIKIIPKWCCYECTQLEEVSIEEGITQISYSAFNANFNYRNRNRLQSLVIPKTVVLLEKDALAGRPDMHVAFLGATTNGVPSGEYRSNTIASPKTTFYVIPGSAMQRYARENNFPMKSLKEFPLK